MSLLQNSNAIPTKDTGYKLTNSLRFRLSASAYLSRTFGTPTSNTTWTWSSWIKRGKTGSDNYFIFGLSSYCGLGFTAADYLGLWSNAGSSLFTTPNKFRDPSAWYHVMYVANGTSVKIYINGELIYTYGSAPPTNINSAVTHRIGAAIPSSLYYDGYMTEIHFVDGQALTPSDFGEYNDITGVWQPKEYTGTYGNNGFYLDMSTSGSTVTDQSGNGNDWTATNMNLTTSTATTYDIMTDVPTLTDENTGNFCTISPIDKNTSNTLSQASLVQDASGSTWRAARSTYFVSSGKWYWEATLNGSGGDKGIIGISKSSQTLSSIPDANGWGYNVTNGWLYTNSAGSSYGSVASSGDVIGIALDMDAGTLVFYLNGVSQGTAVSSLTGELSPTFWQYAGYTWAANFGQRPFAYTPPTGYKKLNTYNLPDSAIKDGSEYMKAVTYTGNNNSGSQSTGSSQSITVGWTPDLIWTKCRSSGLGPQVFDSVRGATYRLGTDSTSAENSGVQGVTSFDSTGYTVGPDWGVNLYNATYVGWSWRGSDSTAVSNTSGTVTSTVSANTTAGFSVVLYTGNGGAMTVGHGLGVAPKMIILKDRDISRAWAVYHGSLATNQYLVLNTTAAVATSTQYWNNTAPTSTVFSVNGAEGNVAANGEKYVAYCFAEVEGFSKFGSYTGNSSADGPFIYTGFRPAFIMIKIIDGAGENWIMYDNQRNPYNKANNTLYANTFSAEMTADPAHGLDMLSNGFKLRNTSSWSDTNLNGYNYLYMAFAESPFKNSLAR